MADIDKMMSQITMIKLVRRLDLLAPPKEYQGNPPIVVWTGRKSGEERPLAKTVGKTQRLGRRPGSMEVNVKQRQLVKYMRMRRPMTRARLASYAADQPLMVTGYTQLSKAARIHSRSGSCGELQTFMPDSISAKKLPATRVLHQPVLASRPASWMPKSSSVSLIKVEGEPKQEHAPQTSPVKQPQGLIRRKTAQHKKRVSVYSKEVQANIAPADPQESASDFYRFRNRCMSSGNQDTTEVSESFGNPQSLLTPWDCDSITGPI